MKASTCGDTPPDVRTGSEAVQAEVEEDPFAEYLWMEHEEEFNQQVTHPGPVGRPHWSRSVT